MEKKKTIRKTASKKEVSEVSTPKATTNKTEVSVEDKPVKESDANIFSQEALAKVVAQLQEEIEDLKNSKQPTRGEKRKSIIEEDFLDPPATFFAYSISFGLYGDKRKNRLNHPPNKQPILFKPHYRYNKNGSTGGKKGAEVVSISRATIRSVSVAKWIREHSLFGIRFFESIKTAIDQDAYLAEKMVSVSNMISALGDMQVINRAKQEGIDISNPDIKLIRQKLIKTIAFNEIGIEKKKKENLASKLGMVENKEISKTASVGDIGTDVY